MKECNECHKNEGIHPWGEYVLCDACHEHISKKYQSPNQDPEIKIPKETCYASWGFYRNGDSEIYLCDDTHLMRTLNHEYMHHVLNIRISPQSSFQYDNIGREHIDPYHSLR